MTSLVDRIVAICDALDASRLPWALGGALALAYATEEPRGTRDIDVNVFVPATDASTVFAALPPSGRHTLESVDCEASLCSSPSAPQLTVRRAARAASAHRGVRSTVRRGVAR